MRELHGAVHPQSATRTESAHRLVRFVLRVLNLDGGVFDAEFAQGVLGGIQQRAGVDGAVTHDVHGREHAYAIQAPQV